MSATFTERGQTATTIPSGSYNLGAKGIDDFMEILKPKLDALRFLKEIGIDSIGGQTSHTKRDTLLKFLEDFMIQYSEEPDAPFIAMAMMAFCPNRERLKIGLEGEYKKHIKESAREVVDKFLKHFQNNNHACKQTRVVNGNEYKDMSCHDISSVLPGFCMYVCSKATRIGGTSAASCLRFKDELDPETSTTFKVLKKSAINQISGKESLRLFILPYQKYFLEVDVTTSKNKRWAEEGKVYQGGYNPQIVTQQNKDMYLMTLSEDLFEFIPKGL